MAVTNGYTTLRKLARSVGIPEGDPLDDELLEDAINAASRQIDGYCGQRFYQDSSVTTRYFTAYGGVVDLTEGGVGGISTSTGLIVATDDTGALTYGTTWATTDYRLLPLHAANDSMPWTELARSPVGNYAFPTDEHAVKITAKFGWAATPDDIERACLIVATDLFKAKDAAFGVAGVGDLGVLRVQGSMNRIAKGLLAPYRLPAVG